MSESEQPPAQQRQQREWTPDDAPPEGAPPHATQPRLTYEAAAARVEEIIRRLDSGEASLDETLALVQEGKALIELCAEELHAVAGALEELRLEDLVARLEGEAQTGEVRP